MDCESMSIVSSVTVDKRETALKSVNMEKVALERSLALLAGQVTISELVTDAHVQIAAFIGVLSCSIFYMLGQQVIYMYFIC